MKLSLVSNTSSECRKTFLNSGKLLELVSEFSEVVGFKIKYKSQLR